MKIIQLNTQKNWRGGERQLSWLLEGFKTKKLEYLLICRKNSPLETWAKQNKITYVSYKIGVFNLIFLAYKISKIIKKSEEKIILNCQDSKSHTIGLIVKVLFTNKFKLVVHRRVIFKIKGWFSQNIKYSSRYIDSIICVSRAVQSEVLKTDSTLRTMVIYSAIKPIHENSSNFIKNLITQEKPIIIGYVAALTEEKDHISFLKVAQKMILLNPTFHFVLIGSGKLQLELENFTKQLQIENKVHFLGFKNNVNELIAEIDLLLFTSKSEGLGSTILDFFMARKPVVTVKNGGVEELVFNNETGFITEIGAVDELLHCCLEVFKNPENTNRMVENAYRFANTKFSVSQMVDATIKEYEMLTND